MYAGRKGLRPLPLSKTLQLYTAKQPSAFSATLREINPKAFALLASKIRGYLPRICLLVGHLVVIWSEVYLTFGRGSS